MISVTQQNVVEARELYLHVRVGLDKKSRAEMEQFAPTQMAIYDALQAVGADGVAKITSQTLTQALEQTGKTVADLKMAGGRCPFGHGMQQLPG